MAQEIERKFLVNGDFKKDAFAETRITQGYISSAPGRTVRIRISGIMGYITIKGTANDSGTTRFEWEKEIPSAEAEELLQLCEPGVIDKTRFLVKSGSHTFEVDEFYGENQGLVIAEIELTKEDEVYIRPEWLGKEVTGIRKYYNSELTKNPFSRWKTRI